MLDAERAVIGVGARVLFHPPLLYDLVIRNKIQAEFRWRDEVDEPAGVCLYLHHVFHPMDALALHEIQRNLCQESNTVMEKEVQRSEHRQKWKKVAYGGMQPGYDDHYTDESFLEDMVMNANLVKRDFVRVMLDSISISEYLCIVALVVIVWTQTLSSIIDAATLLSLDAILLFSGFAIILLTTRQLSVQLLSRYLLKVSFFISGLYILAPIYHTLTRSISSDSIWALSASILIVHLFLHDYFGCSIRPPGSQNNPTLVSNISLNASIVSSVLVASRLPSRLQVFGVMLFSLEIFLVAPLVAFCIRKYSFNLHLWFSFLIMSVTLGVVYTMHHLLFVLLLGLLIFVSVVCPYWLIRIQEYKFEINGPWDEAKLCFDITE